LEKIRSIVRESQRTDEEVQGTIHTYTGSFEFAANGIVFFVIEKPVENGDSITDSKLGRTDVKFHFHEVTDGEVHEESTRGVLLCFFIIVGHWKEFRRRRSKAPLCVQRWTHAKENPVNLTCREKAGLD
jgi:hypothetical protein